MNITGLDSYGDLCYILSRPAFWEQRYREHKLGSFKLKHKVSWQKVKTPMTSCSNPGSYKSYQTTRGFIKQVQQKIIGIVIITHLGTE